jgi:flagellar biosynthesis/type III secretory pathway protein FliH
VIGAGRIIKAGSATDLPTPRIPALSNARARILPQAVVAAHEQAAQIRRRALAECAELRTQTELELGALREQAAAEGRAAGYAELTALVLAQKAREAGLEAAAQTRAITVARLLAERVIGHAVELTPALVGDLALSALNEVRGARRVQLFVHPGDEAQVAPRVAALRLPAASVSVECDPELASGQLRILTEMGSFEANLGRRLDLLCEALGKIPNP